MNNDHHTLKAPLLSAIWLQRSRYSPKKITLLFQKAGPCQAGILSNFSHSPNTTEIPTAFAMFRLIGASIPHQQLIEIFNLIISDKRV